MMKKVLAILLTQLLVFPLYGQNTHIGPVVSSSINNVFISPLAFGAKCDGSTDDTAAFTAAIAFASNGGTITIPASASGCKFSTALTISANSVILQGTGWSYGAQQAPSTLKFAAGVSGLILSGNAVTVRDLAVIGSDTGANSDVGIHFTGGRPSIEHVLVQSFGGAGFEWDSTGAKNVDHWYAADLRSLSNFGDGFLFVGGTDTNAGVGLDMDASLNGGIGFNLSTSGVNENTFIGPLAATNTGGDYVLAGSSSSNYFLNAYCESGTGSSFVIGASSVFNQVIFPNFGECATITNSGGISNNIYYQYSSAAGVNNVVLNPPPGTAVGSGKTYQINSGQFNPKDLDIRDVTGAADLLDYNNSLSGWFALKPFYFTNFTSATSAGSTNSGIGGFFSSCWNGSVPQNDFFNTQVIGGSGTNGTERLTHSHTAGCSGYTSEVFQYPFGGKTLIQNAANDFAGSCAMSAGTTCTFSLNQGFQNTPLTFVSIDGASTPPATAISAKCAISSTTVTITAGTSNSLTWDCLLVGNPN